MTETDKDNEQELLSDMNGHTKHRSVLGNNPNVEQVIRRESREEKSCQIQIHELIGQIPKL